MLSDLTIHMYVLLPTYRLNTFLTFSYKNVNSYHTKLFNVVSIKCNLVQISLLINLLSITVVNAYYL